MKRILTVVVVTSLLSSLHQRGDAQGMGYGPQIGYAVPIAYAPEMPYLQGMASSPGAGFVAWQQVETGVDPGDDEATHDCDGCGSCDACRKKRRCRSVSYWGEFLYLRPRDSEVAFAVPIDGPIVPPPSANPIQIGPVAIVDVDYSPGFRVGFAVEFDDWTRIGGEYTHFESRTSNATSIAAPDVIRSLVAHPSSQSASTAFLTATANYDIDFDLVDVDYRCIFACGDRYSLNYLVGVRYGRLQQEFSSQFVNGVVEAVNTQVRFDGGGIRLGLEGERHAKKCGLLVYGRTAASFVAGEFRATYLQGSSVDPVVVDTRWKAGRIVSMLDLELGAGWARQNGCLRLTAGYTISAWFNTLKTDEFIAAVQSNNFVGLGDRMTFDGFVARAELRF